MCTGPKMTLQTGLCYSVMRWNKKATMQLNCYILQQACETHTISAQQLKPGFCDNPTRINFWGTWGNNRFKCREVMNSIVSTCIKIKRNHNFISCILNEHKPIHCYQFEFSRHAHIKDHPDTPSDRYGLILRAFAACRVNIPHTGVLGWKTSTPKNTRIALKSQMPQKSKNF